MFTFSKKRLSGFIFAALIPFLVILLGAFLLISGTVFNISFAISYFLIPLIACALLALCVFSELRASTKSWLSIFILVILIVALLFAFALTLHECVVSYTGEEAVAEYSVIQEYECFVPLPSIADVGEPLSLEYHNYFGAQYIFSWDAYYLVCKYDEQMYASEKKKLEEKYVYQEKAIYASGYTCEPTTQIDGFTFRMLSVDDEQYDELWYPKCMVLTGYSDETKEIVYLAYYDSDLDYVESIEHFIIDCCGWKHIR